MGSAFQKFKQGLTDYRMRKPRPPIPADDDPHPFRWIGWMIGRARDLQAIFDEADRLRDLGYLDGEVARDRYVSRRVRDHDRSLGLPIRFERRR